MQVTVTINGEERSADVEPRTRCSSTSSATIST